MAQDLLAGASERRRPSSALSRIEAKVRLLHAQSALDPHGVRHPCPVCLGCCAQRRYDPPTEIRAVVGGANNQLAEAQDAERLQARDILYAPDYVVNVGGAMALLGLETQGWTQERAEKEVADSVRRALRQVFELAATEGITTEAAARDIAEERLSAGT